MRHKRDKERILEALREMPVLKYALTKTAIPRSTVYRWLKEDSVFKAKFDEVIDHGVEDIDDVSTSKVIKGIHEGKPWAIKYWADRKHKKRIDDEKEIKVDPDGPIKLADALKKEFSFGKTMADININKLRIEVTARRAMRNMPDEGMAEQILFALTANKRHIQEKGTT